MSNRSVAAMGMDSSPSRVVMIDMQQAKNIFNSGKADTHGNLLTPNDPSRNGEDELVSLRSR